MEPNTGVTFGDVAGVDEAKQDFMEVSQAGGTAAVGDMAINTSTRLGKALGGGHLMSASQSRMAAVETAVAWLLAQGAQHHQSHCVTLWLCADC
jgi:hypothetical protein